MGRGEILAAGSTSANSPDLYNLPLPSSPSLSLLKSSIKLGARSSHSNNNNQILMTNLRRPRPSDTFGETVFLESRTHSLTTSSISSLTMDQSSNNSILPLPEQDIGQQKQREERYEREFINFVGGNYERPTPPKIQVKDWYSHVISQRHDSNGHHIVNDFGNSEIIIYSHLDPAQEFYVDAEKRNRTSQHSYSNSYTSDNLYHDSPELSSSGSRNLTRADSLTLPAPNLIPPLFVNSMKNKFDFGGSLNSMTSDSSEDEIHESNVRISFPTSRKYSPTNFYNGDNYIISNETPSKNSLESNVLTNKSSKVNVIINTKKAPVIGLLIIFSMMGVLIRLALVSLETYDGQQVFAEIYPQIVGCCIMGFINARQVQLVETYFPMTFVLGTGLCGSITSFSDFTLVIFEIIIGYSNADSIRSKVLTTLSHIVLTTGMSLIAFEFGEHLANILWPLPSLLSTNSTASLVSPSCPAHSSRRFTLNSISRFHSDSFKPFRVDTNIVQFDPPNRRYAITSNSWSFHNLTLIDYTFFIFGLSLYVFVLFFVIYSYFSQIFVSTRELSITLALAPLGTFLRLAISSMLNSQKKSFPMGTFAANMLGCIVVGIMIFLSGTTGSDDEAVRSGSEIIRKSILRVGNKVSLTNNNIRTSIVSRLNMKIHEIGFGSGITEVWNVPEAGNVETWCQVIDGVVNGFCGCLTTGSAIIYELRVSRKSYVYGLVTLICGTAAMTLTWKDIRMGLIGAADLLYFWKIANTAQKFHLVIKNVYRYSFHDKNYLFLMACVIEDPV
ncbi:5062_t:CDS:2 [Acaulospora morrowiae]|uniref:5062_t:CDS:1 n=1 Tax=Acaulospora morrowiae TaxID=94023 RepID=A0A9N8ZA34_9GLOM|nr:5062_t:CDS:2 [Acaulospora morrowiae]